MALSQSCSPLESHDGCGNCASFPHSSRMAMAALCVLCLWCNRALSLLYRQWLLCSVEEFYGTRRIWPLCMSHYVPHHGRNAGSQHHFFCSCINELWQIDQTKARRGTQIINFLLLLFVGAHLKEERRITHPQEGARHVSLCSALVVSVVKATLLYYFTSIQSVPQLRLMM